MANHLTIRAQRLKLSPTARTMATPYLFMRRRRRENLSHKQAQSLRHFTDLLAADLILQLDDFRGKFTIGARSDLFRRIAADGCYEPDLAQLC